jgi:Protein of unknown function (DUF3108)
MGRVTMKSILSVKAIVIVSAVLMGASASAQPADEISAGYDVSFAGARIMRASYSATLSDGAYTTALDAKTVGVSKWLKKIKLNMNATGKLNTSGVTPGSYNYARKKNDKRKERSLSFASNGDLVTTGTDYDESILKAISASVMDPLSMLLKLTRTKSPCSGKHRAFDGRDVFDITLSETGKTGTAINCKVVYTPIAGGDVDEGDTEPQSYEITLVPLGSASGYIPVRIAGSTKGVGFDVTATEVSVNGTALAY